jgi:glycogen operon protein
MGRTQRGNNNAYCHDSELNYIDWELDQRRAALLAFARRVFQLRRSNPVFRRRRYFAGDTVADDGGKDVVWVRADGQEMEHEDWVDPRNRLLGMLIHGDASDEVDERGRPNLGQTLYLLMNASTRTASATLPPLGEKRHWREIINTAAPGTRVPKGAVINVAPHTLVLLCHEDNF